MLSTPENHTEWAHCSVQWSHYSQQHSRQARLLNILTRGQWSNRCSQWRAAYYQLALCRSGYTKHWGEVLDWDGYAYCAVKSKPQHISTATLLLFCWSTAITFKLSSQQILAYTPLIPFLSLSLLKIVLWYFITVNAFFEMLKGQHCKLGILNGMITAGSDIGVTYVEALMLVCDTEGR